MRLVFSLVLLFSLSYQGNSCLGRTSTQWVEEDDHLRPYEDETPLPTDSLTLLGSREVFLRSLRYSLPMIAVGGLSNFHNKDIRAIRNEYIPKFRYHYDDYMQFAPLLTQVSLNLAGVRGSSQYKEQVLTADAMATAIMLTMVTSVKSLSKVQRPDGSSHNSFPSGHTAMAFTSATLLDLEYGERYPWLSALGYASAAGAGIGRLMNNRHWTGDVITGAGVGMLSGHLGYMLSDWIWGQRKRAMQLGYNTDDLSGVNLITSKYNSTGLGTKVADVEFVHRQNAVGLKAGYTFRSKWFVLGGLSVVRHSLVSEDRIKTSPIIYKSMLVQSEVGMRLPIGYGMLISPSVRMGLDFALEAPKPRTDSWAISHRLDPQLGIVLSGSYRFSKTLSVMWTGAIDRSFAPAHLIRGVQDYQLNPWRLSFGSGIGIHL